MSEIIIGICVIAYIMIGIFLGELLFESEMSQGLTFFFWPLLLPLAILLAIVVIPCELASKLKEKM